MGKKLRFDAATVEAILAGDHAASPWLSGTGSLDELSVEDAVSALEAARRNHAVQPLLAARDNDSRKAVRKAAGAALHRLKSAGVSIEEPRSTATWKARGAALDAPPPPAALIGLPDPSGYFPFVVVAYGQHEACASAGLAGAGQGHIDAEHGHLSRSDARNVLRNTQRQQGLREVPFHVALHFLQRAFDEGGQGQPNGFGHLLESVPEGVKNSARLLDPLEGQETTLDVDAMHAIEPLLDPHHGVYLALGEEPAYAAMTQIGEALGSPIAMDEETRLQRIRGIVDAAADDYLNEGARRSWSLALDVVSYLAKQDNNPALRSAARHTALALRSDRPARDIPFVREWINAQLQSVVEMFMAQSAVPGVDLGEEGDDSPGIILTDG